MKVKKYRYRRLKATQVTADDGDHFGDCGKKLAVEAVFTVEYEHGLLMI